MTPSIESSAEFRPLPFIKGKLVPHAKLQTYDYAGLKEFIHIVPYNSEWGTPKIMFSDNLARSEESDSPSPASPPPARALPPKPAPTPVAETPSQYSSAPSRAPGRAVPPTPQTAPSPRVLPPAPAPVRLPPPTPVAVQTSAPPSRSPPTPVAAASPDPTPRETDLSLDGIGPDFNSPLSPGSLGLVQPPTSRVESLPPPTFVALNVNLNSLDNEVASGNVEIHDPTVEGLSLDTAALSLIFEARYQSDATAAESEAVDIVDLSPAETNKFALLDGDVEAMHKSVSSFPPSTQKMTHSPFVMNGIRQYHGLDEILDSPLVASHVAYLAPEQAQTELVLWQVEGIKLTKTIWFDILGKVGEPTLSQATVGFLKALTDLMGVSIDYSDLQNRGKLAAEVLNLANGVSPMEKLLYDKLLSHTAAIKRKEEKKQRAKRKKQH
eukprot:TRINITY_DN47_c1_g1_i1.p1 TRINITY_DN47_c1_g1~~TRINITY_DN47_c1_g1_i1.p1  ORF type:complete len:494 (-),score=136.29 TRINITY_DN47_c1_g1_i1:162-1475(-)